MRFRSTKPVHKNPVAVDLAAMVEDFLAGVLAAVEVDVISQPNYSFRSRNMFFARLTLESGIYLFGSNA